MFNWLKERTGIEPRLKERTGIEPQTPRNRGCCGACAHYDRGACKRFPPIFTNAKGAIWPQVNSSDHCGEWEAG